MNQVKGFAVAYKVQTTNLLNFGFLLPATCFLLSACAEPPSASKYQINALLPAPATPGETIVAYGNLPKNASVWVGDNAQALPTTEVLGGAQFTLPAAQTAGELKLTFTGDNVQLSSTLQVVPRLDSAVLQGGILKVSGAGWPQDPKALSSTLLEVENQSLTPTLEGLSLVATLPSNLPYGSLQVRVRVGNQASDTYTLLREAGAVTGKVELPATAQAEGQTKANWLNTGSLQSQTRHSLVVYHQPQALGNVLLEGLHSRQSFKLAGQVVTNLRFSDETRAQRAKDRLQRLPGVQHVAFDSAVRQDGSQAAGLMANPSPQQWHLPLMGLPQAWDKTKGEGVVVAVVDTGILLNHPDLQANLLPGYDFVDGNAQPMDTAGHGTHVAGLIAANGQVFGAAPKAKLLPVRVLSGNSGGSAFTVAQGILWAAGLLPDLPNPNPAQVINLSLGTPEFSQPMADAVAQALAKGVIVVAAAGNDGSNALSYPAALPRVISATALAGPVTAYQPYYATKGPGLQLTAYGGDMTQDQDGNGVSDGMVSTDRGEDGSPIYAQRMGTSMASPLVAGIAALALSSGIPSALVQPGLQGTVNDLGVLGYDPKFGYGLATGRVVTTTSPKTYIVALDTAHRVLGWSLGQTDLSFGLSNLPPGASITLVAATDSDHDGVLGEAGEMISNPQPFTPRGGQTVVLSTALTLNPSDGDGAIALIAVK